MCLAKCSGFGTELPLLLAPAFVVLGPKRMHAMYGRIAGVKAEFDKASRGIKSQLAIELQDALQVREKR